MPSFFPVFRSFVAFVVTLFLLVGCQPPASQTAEEKIQPATEKKAPPVAVTEPEVKKPEPPAPVEKPPVTTRQGGTPNMPLPPAEEIVVTKKPGDPGAIPSPDSLIPFRSSWIYPTILNNRPADGLESPVNPPRFSWAYVPEIVPDDADAIDPTVFTFQLSKSDSFFEPEIEVIDTPYNFYNALPVLEDGTWYWRVGYGKAPRQKWGEVRRFTVGPESVKWDRTVINQAVEKLAAQARPRLGPKDGNWKAFYRDLEKDPRTQDSLRRLKQAAEYARAQPYWNNFPETDNLGRPPKVREEKTRFIFMLQRLMNAAYYYRLTEDEQYAPALDYIVKMAEWPRGGLLSPEALSGHTKMPSQAAEIFAAAYDMFQDKLTPEQLDTLKEAVRWRLHDMYFDPKNIVWQRGDESMVRFGLAYVAGSHPYQNYAWTVPAILLMAGEMEEADKLVPLSLNYLAGVTASDGPDEGYNEGHGYSNEKAGTTLRAVEMTDMLLPELEMGKNPMIQNLVGWFAYMFPGTERLPWGDSWMTTTRGGGGENMRRLTYLTESPLAKYLWQTRAKGNVSDNPMGLYSRSWLELAAWDRYQDKVDAISDEAESGDVLFLPEAGWLFVQSQPILDHEDYKEAVGLQMQFRPRGGYSHSFPSDGSFAWYGYGEDLSIAGGWRSWASLAFCRSPMSQNSLLINGEGHDGINPFDPKRPYTARPLIFEEGENYLYFVADLTPGYQRLGDITRVHRHVLFVEKKWFVIYDELALPMKEDPATFHWLFHVYQNVPVEIQEGGMPGFSYEIGKVRAQVQFANAPGSLALENRPGEEGYKNPITGVDHYPKDMQRAKSRGIFKKFINYPLMANNLWISNAKPEREFHFLAVLSAAKKPARLPKVTAQSDKVVTISQTGGVPITISFDPNVKADYMIDPAKARQHAEGAPLAGGAKLVPLVQR